LCQRRNWPEPLYQVKVTRQGYSCVVRVNNREYQTSKYSPSESSAKEAAALVAFNICRSFSANDGMYPTGFAHGGVIQGNPVPVGSGRHSLRSDASNTGGTQYRYRGESDSAESRSGGSSPDSHIEFQYDTMHSPTLHRSTYGTPGRHESRSARDSSVRY